MKKTILQIALLFGILPVTHAQKDTLFRYKCRIGINSGIGHGFNATPWLALSDGTDSHISFGGGTVAQFKYGYEVNHFFDLLFDIGVQFSELDKPVSNASTFFGRYYISFTQSFIVPILGGERMCLKLGAGLAYVYSPVLEFDLSEIPGGFKDDWQYKNTISQHLLISFERKTRKKRFSFNTGLKFYRVHYTFDHGNVSYPLGPDLKKPNGSGFDFVMGFNYHFNWKKGTGSN